MDLLDSLLSDSTDPYIDPQTGLLRNLLGATTREEFVERETRATFHRTVKLEADPVELTGDLRQLQEIHRRIFQDVFVWAGQTRTDEIRKSDDYFMSPSVFATDGVKVFTDLAAEDLLVGISPAGSGPPRNDRISGSPAHGLSEPGKRPRTRLQNRVRSKTGSDRI